MLMVTLGAMDMGWRSMSTRSSSNLSFTGGGLTLSDECYYEKRRVFLNSYHFCRKTTVADRIKASFIRVSKQIIILFRLRSPKKFYFRLRYRSTGRRRYHRLFNNKSSNTSLDWCRSRTTSSSRW
ncbi:hypothetical protein AQUCO_00300210v1 [Aquilegia coerulea]|uniref:Uncharacterized protein n=1 Tax=Aquilegia coerulea TaxID=218851 RepID=A0A2G5EXS3_AQUCA|nr:hypothetical protein AQUCO_00300210v1 [Aquilegia coerulea]